MSEPASKPLIVTGGCSECVKPLVAGERYQVVIENHHPKLYRATAESHPVYCWACAYETMHRMVEPRETALISRPKKLYRYDQHHNLDVHAVTSECCPQVVDSTPLGIMWRCRHDHVDAYGFDKRKTAKAEEIDNTKNRIAWELDWLKKLTGEAKVEADKEAAAQSPVDCFCITKPIRNEKPNIQTRGDRKWCETCGFIFPATQGAS